VAVVHARGRKSLVFSRDDDADDDECSQYQSLKSFVVFLFSVL